MKMKSFEEVLRSYGLTDDEGQINHHFSHVEGAVNEYIEPLVIALQSTLSQNKILLSKLGHYTCSLCGDNNACEYAFDDYNTNGDCLTIK